MTYRFRISFDQSLQLVILGLLWGQGTKYQPDRALTALDEICQVIMMYIFFWPI